MSASLRLASRLIPALAVVAAVLLPAAAHAVVPDDNGELAHATVVTGACLRDDQKADGRLDYWMVWRATPDHIHSPARNTELIPDPLPQRPEAFPYTSTGLIAQDQGGVIPPPGKTTCTPEVWGSFGNVHADGSGLAIDEPGIYWHYQVHASAHWDWVADGASQDVPPPKACADNDPRYPWPGDVREPVDRSGGHWELTSWCTKVESHRFFVTNDAGECPVSPLDRSNWPLTTYFNQYDAGLREDLPQASDAKKGGNACGPSSTMMGVLQALRREFGEGPPPAPLLDEIDQLGELPDVYDRVMSLTRAQQAPMQKNSAVAGKIASFLKSIGFEQAEPISLGTGLGDVTVGNRNTIMQELAKNPVIISTAFGGAKWGTTGGGHVILLRNLDVRHPNDYIVDDPAGNWFSTHNAGSWPTGHYGKGSCGAGVAYPMDWVDAYTTGRWLVSMGLRTGAAPPVPGLAKGAAAAGGARGVPVISLSAGAAGAPATFYLQDPQGRREGFVDGKPVDEIPDGYAVQVLDGDAGPDGDSALTPVRTLAVPRPAAGTTLHVADPHGGTFGIDETAYDSGRVVAQDQVSATVAAGGSATPAAPALLAVSGGSPTPGDGGAGG